VFVGRFSCVSFNVSTNQGRTLTLIIRGRVGEERDNKVNSSIDTLRPSPKKQRVQTVSTPPKELLNALDYPLVKTYVRRLVRKEAFLIYCGPEHECVRSEIKLLSESIDRINSHFSKLQINGKNSKWKKYVRVFLYRFVVSQIDAMEFDNEIKLGILAAITESDFGDIIPEVSVN